MTPLLGNLGYYCLLRRLGYGGMSEIYLAYDELRLRNVALKVVDMAREDHVQRFQREVETLVMLSHEHIVPIYDWGKQDGHYFYSMPYYAGGSLRDRLGHGPLSLEEAGSIFEQVASALHYAHERGVLHRDIKPSNILFRNERSVYLADFGLARQLGQEGGITQTGCLIGTPEYIAPELATEPASQRSDIYALGVLLYKMLTGRVPFRGGTPLTLYWKHASEPPARPSSLNPLISLAIERVMLKALEKDPADRFGTAQEMAVAYRQALQVLKQPRSASELGTYLAYRLKLTRIRARSVTHFLRLKVGDKERSMLTRLHRGAGVCAMIVLLCVAPFLLGFSLSRNTLEQAPSLLSLQSVTTFLDTQPVLQGRGQQPAQGTSLGSLSPLRGITPTHKPSTSLRTAIQHTSGKQDNSEREHGERQEGGRGKGHGDGHGKSKGGHHSHPGKSARHGKK